MSSPRIGLSLTFVLGGIVLLSAIVVGNHIGDSVLGQVGGRGGALPPGQLPTPIVQPVETDGPPIKNWKRLQVMSVATDPGFPDPRITPAPTPTEAPYQTPKPSPTPHPRPTNHSDIPIWRMTPSPPSMPNVTDPPAFPEESSPPHG